MTIYRLGDHTPHIDPSAFVAPSADLIGSVSMARYASIWFHAVARGDNDQIEIGERSNVQDHCMLHADPGIPLQIGKNVTVGHCATLHGCTIGDGSLIGIGSVIMNHAKIGESCIVGANTLIAEGKEFPARSLVLGSPGRILRELDHQEVEQLNQLAQVYVNNILRYRQLTAVPDSSNEPRG